MTKAPVQPEWHHLDAAGKGLGRLANQAAQLLLAKQRVDAMPHTIAPVFIVITNTDRVVVTGKKEEAKVYRHNTGYPGGVRERTLAEQRQRDSRRLVRAAVAGMLPKNSLRDKRLLHLKLYTGPEHNHQAQL